MLTRCCAVLAALAALLSIADAGEPDWIVPLARRWPPGPTRDYLRNLRRPEAYHHEIPSLCCDEGETVDTKFKVEPGDGPHPEDRWYALLDGEWEKVVPDYAPDGRAYVFVMYSVIQCLVRPRGGL